MTLPTLRYRADRRTLVFLTLHALSITAAFVWWRQLPGVAIAGWVLLLCSQAFATAVITHNTVHVPMFEQPWANRAAQLVISALYGGSVSVFVRGHNFSHHKHTQTPRDLMRTTKARFRWNLLNQVLFLAIVGPGIERGNRAFVDRERALATPWYRQHQQERWTVRCLTLLALVIDWRAALLFVLVPRVFGIWAITGINFTQHDGCAPRSRYDHSRNFVGRLLNWFLFNNGYHTVHHDAPRLHWSELPARHAATVGPFIHPALDQRSLLGFCWRQYVYPGRRVRFDGAPVVLPPPEPDVSWVPDTLVLSEELSVGAAGEGPP